MHFNNDNKVTSTAPNALETKLIGASKSYLNSNLLTLQRHWRFLNIAEHGAE